MSTQEIIDYYANLLILQYVGKPKAFATIQALVDPVVMNQLPLQVQNAYNLTGPNLAVGKQLDVIGKYVGASRSGIGVNGPFTLNDADFLSLIFFAIIRNSSGSSLYDIQLLINEFFAGEVLVFDYANMQMSYMVSSSVGNLQLVEAAISQNLLPKPMGVGVSAVIFNPVINKFFGFRTYVLPPFNNSPFNTYSSYQTDRPWLSYADAVSF